MPCIACAVEDLLTYNFYGSPEAGDPTSQEIEDTPGDWEYFNEPPTQRWVATAEAHTCTE